MKTKTYVLTLSRTFPKGHPREGHATEFAYSFMKALYAEEHKGDDLHADYPKPHKLHTIRADYGLWKHRIDEVNAGRAVLSVRQWLGAPRRSKQLELFRLDRNSGIGVERLELNRWNILDDDPERRKWYWVGRPLDDRNIRATAVREDDLAGNDGLSLEDWNAWFSNPRYDRSQPMAIIHFTSFRYCK